MDSVTKHAEAGGEDKHRRHLEGEEENEGGRGMDGDGVILVPEGSRTVISGTLSIFDAMILIALIVAVAFCVNIFAIDPNRQVLG